MWTRRQILSLLGVGLLLVGCASTQRNLTQVSAVHTGCPESQVVMDSIQRSATRVTWEAEGCGKRSLCTADDMMRTPTCTPREATAQGRARR